ncbi:MAG: hypothetical protein SGI88_18540 [Candidatus Hydrogenedentes bacterium]|nr:hypothetical protein [Candidatus Hydrogenedentota bacterium]
MTPWFANTLMLAAAAILVFCGCAHSYLGERFLFRRLFALPDLPLFHHDRRYTESVLRFAWHLTSLAWWGFAAILLSLAIGAPTLRVVGGIIGITILLTGTIIVATAGKRHPAWWLFLLAGGLIIAASW